MTSPPISTPTASDHTEDVPLGRRGTGAEDEVRGGQGVEVGDVAVDVVSHVEQLTELLGGLRGLDPNTPSSALVEQRWWAPGHTPQSLEVSLFSSSTDRPMQNFSKPLSSGTCQ